MLKRELSYSHWIQPGKSRILGVEDFHIYLHVGAFCLIAIWYVMNIYQNQVNGIRTVNVVGIEGFGFYWYATCATGSP